MHKCSIERGRIAAGTVMADVEVRGAVIGLRSVIGTGTNINDSVLMGNDYYGTEKNDGKRIPPGIGRNCHIEKAIIDKNVNIGDNCYVSPEGKTDGDYSLFCIRDGVIVIPKGTIIAAGTTL